MEKQYLAPCSDCYRLMIVSDTAVVNPAWIEVPEGAEIYANGPYNPVRYFFKRGERGLDVFVNDAWRPTSITGNQLSILWQRKHKEYLVNSQDGEWRLETELSGDPNDDVIEVPEGAEVYGYPPDSRFAYFHKTVDGVNWFYSPMMHHWSTSGHNAGEFDRVLWQRDEVPSLPEELPFIDDGYNPFGYGDGENDTQGHYSAEEPPAHFLVRPKPRVRMAAELGESV